MQKTGIDAGRLPIPEVKERIEKALEPFGYAKPAVGRIANSDIYFSAGIYEKLKVDPAAMRAVLDAIRSVPGVAEVFRAEELQGRPATQNPLRTAEANSYFEGRTGDLFLVPKPHWLRPSIRPYKTHDRGTGAGTPYNYH